MMLMIESGMVYTFVLMLMIILYGAHNNSFYIVYETLGQISVRHVSFAPSHTHTHPEIHPTINFVLVDHSQLDLACGRLEAYDGWRPGEDVCWCLVISVRSISGVCGGWWCAFA
jgi:hypothetical protein